MDDPNGNTNAEIPTPLGPLKLTGKKTAEFITVILAIGVGVMSYVIWVHARDSEERDVKIERAISNSASAQRFFACIIAQPQEKRMQQVEQTNSFCNQMAKQ